MTVMAIRVDIVRYLDSSYPGFVECRLVDAAGREHFFRDKVPVVTLADIDEHSDYPQPGGIGCTVISRRIAVGGREVVEVDTEKPWAIDSTTGQMRFEVFADQLEELP